MKEDTEKRGKFFTLATTATHQLCEDLIQKYHLDLDSASAKVDIVMAFRDPDGEAPAMEKDGHRILGKASLITLKDRVKGMGDCEIMLDGDAWENLERDAKAALMDHELQHFEVKRDKKGDFVYDDLTRPVLKIRPHDRQFGWFDTVAQRHRGNSMEVQQIQKLFAEAGQIYLPFVQKDGAIEESQEPTMSVSVNGAPPVPMTSGGLLGKIRKTMKEEQAL